MKILRMTASFGRLAGETLTLTEGLNLIALPNEGGKSTWCAFLRAMLYGIPTRERNKAGAIAEKNRYLPWSGGPLEGTMDVVWQEKKITLRRSSKAGAPMGVFTAVYTGTEEAVPGLTGENCGETLLGVVREVFERTAFVGQSGVQIDGSPELETRIAALASSGEEDVSFSATQQILRDWKNARMANKAVGAIPKKREEQQVLEETLSRLRQAESVQDRARQELEGLALRRKQLEGARAYHKQQENLARTARHEALQRDLKIAQEEERALKIELERFGDLPATQELRSAQGELTYLSTMEANLKQAVLESGRLETAAREARSAAADPLFSGMTPEQARSKMAADRVDIAAAAKKPTGLWVCGAVLLLLAMVPIFFWINPAVSLVAQLKLLIPALGVALVVAAVGCGIAAVMLKGRRSAKKSALLAAYRAVDVGELDAYCARYETKWNAALEGEKNAEMLALQVAQLSHQKEELLQKLREFAKPFAPDVTDGVSLSVAFSRALMLQDKLQRAAGRTAEAQRVWQAVSADGPLPETEGVRPIPTEATAQETEAAFAAVKSEESRLRDTLSRAQGEMSTLGDPQVLTARENCLREELTTLEGEYEALSLALEGLEAANASLQTRFSPEVNRTAGEIFSKLTGGEYTAVALTRDFEALATESGGLLPRRALTLSRGTGDQLYLAVRLGVCDLALAGAETVPLVLDDALVTFDDRRLALALDYLKERGTRQQILLFSCQDREKRILAL
ncbi:MAG: AAA family ATPase [Oscillospiraceae bacterium]